MSRAFLAGLASLGLLTSCGDKADGDDSGTGGPASEPCGEPCELQDAHNFTYETDLQFEVVEAQALADVCLDWSALSVDIQGHAFTEGIDEIRLAVFGTLSYDEIRDGLASDQLQQSDLSLYMECEPDGPDDTDCCLSEFGLLGSYPGIDQYFEEGSGSWLFTFDTEGVDGTRTMVLLIPTSESSTTLVEIDDETCSLDMDVDLSSSTRALVAGGTAELTLDWSALTRDGLGNELAHEKINELQLARYEASAEELAENFFDLKTLASETWSMSVAGETSASLTALEGDTPFTGLSTEGTWLLALWCTVCENPVPKAIVILEAEQ